MFDGVVGPHMFDGVVGQGRVVAGHYIDGTVSTGCKGDLDVRAGLKWRRLTAAEVAEWAEVPAGTGGATSAAGAIGRIVVDAVLPPLVSKVAGVALDATLGSTARPPRTVRVDWSDGKQSVIRLPEKLFAHLAAALEDRRAAGTPAPGPDPVAPRPGPRSDVPEQIGRLALLRDQGALTEEEFSSKKGELLARL
jgi:hypothetical protein